MAQTPSGFQPGDRVYVTGRVPTRAVPNLSPGQTVTATERSGVGTWVREGGTLRSATWVVVHLDEDPPGEETYCVPKQVTHYHTPTSGETDRYEGG